MHVARTRKWTEVAVLAGFVVGSTSIAMSDDASRIGRKVPNVATLRNVQGRSVPFHSLENANCIVLIFVGTECPLVNLYVPRLIELEKRYRNRGVAFVAVNSNAGDSIDAVAAYAMDRDLPFLTLKDFDHGLADALGAQRTPEAFVLDSDFVLRYRGRIDDQFGVGIRLPEPKHRDLIDAIDQVLVGTRVAVPRTFADGCLIDRRPRKIDSNGMPPTFTRDVLPILQNHCQSCHRPGRVGQFPLIRYEQVARRADPIREVIVQRRMPPWHADKRYGTFRNDRRLHAGGRDTLLSWIDGGMPRGAEKDRPPPVAWVDEWRIGRPDRVFEMPRAFTVPATGLLPYRRFVIPTEFETDRWVQAAEVVPGNPQVVGHILVYIQKPGRLIYDPSGSVRVLAGFAPGDEPAVAGPGTGILIPKGWNLIFEVHYNTIGVATTDRSRVGMIFCEEKPERMIRTNILGNFAFRLPAGNPHCRAESTYTFKRDARILSLLPHMHLRGKSWRYELIDPDGKRKTILSVPRWDFNWQTTYLFEKPVFAPKGTRLRSIAHWDNSPYNPNNPDPTVDVGFGLQTWDEMMNGWMSYVWDDPDTRTARK